MASTQYRNITIDDQGIVHGEHNEYGSWCSFSGRIDLMWIKAALGAGQRAHRSIWALQDGYGSPGFTPPQGCDWSGIRDSSPEAIAAMYELAQEILPGFLRGLESARVVTA